MSVGVFEMNGQRFRIVAEDEYKMLRSALREWQRAERQDAVDLKEAKRRLKDPKRKTVSLAGLKTDLGL